MVSYGSYGLDYHIPIQDHSNHSVQSTITASKIGLELVVIHQHHP